MTNTDKITWECQRCGSAKVQKDKPDKRCKRCDTHYWRVGNPYLYTCKNCEGEGEVNSSIHGKYVGRGECPECDGKGYKNKF